MTDYLQVRFLKNYKVKENFVIQKGTVAHAEFDTAVMLKEKGLIELVPACPKF